jgi:glycosyltransferase involved in cell wall biosynthesis
MKRVAVITRTKNRPLLLPRVRASIERQAYRNLVWVLVNDAGEAEYVDREAQAARQNGLDVLTVHLKKSKGMEAASNEGIRRSESNYIVVHDDDDTWQPEFLAKTVAFLDTRHEYVGVVTHASYVKEKVENDTIRILSKKAYNTGLRAVYLADMALCNRFPNNSFLFRRSVLDEVGGYNESMPVLGDWDFNLRVLSAGDIGVVPDPLANFHQRIDSRSLTDEYRNTVTRWIDRHYEYDAAYRNRKLREDMAGNRVGLGFILAAARLQQQSRGERFFGFSARILGKLGLKSLFVPERSSR